ncbi:MAG: hypothetical protein IPH69_11520 [Bacteroidales bacterium]|nr:hypothetical protein [Bacteroidales bacterium]
MESETRKSPSYLFILLIIIMTAVVAFVAYYSIMERRSPAKKMAEISDKYGFAKYEKQKLPESITSDSTFLSLFKEEAYLQSRAAMAKTDSVYLTINLSDSVINIEISGVVVHSTSINEFEASKLITHGDEFVITSLLSAPLNIVSDTSSIEKIPIILKIAPKDTSEFIPDAIPDTAFYEPVNYIFDTDRGIKIFVYQSEEVKQGDSKDRFMFDLRQRLIYTRKALKDILAFKVPEYQPYIKIKIPSADAKIIYRAVPRHGQIAVYL